MSQTRREIFAAITDHPGIPESAKLDLLNSIANIFDDLWDQLIREMEQPPPDLSQPPPMPLYQSIAREYMKRYPKPSDPAPATEPAPAPAAAGES
jgi:hypothetical protein